MSERQPIILLTIFSDTTVRFGTRHYVDGSNNEYLPRLSWPGEISEDLPDMYYGFENFDTVSFEIADGSQADSIDSDFTTWIASNELRGSTIQAVYYNDTDGEQLIFRGVIIDYTLKPGEKLSVTCDVREDRVFDIQFPTDTITADDWDASALDVGKPVNVVIGNVVNVPCPNVMNNRTSDYYDYLIGHGPIEGLDTSTGRGVKRDGRLVSAAEYTLLNDDVAYPDMAVIRFTREQLSFQGTYHQITADVKGLKMGGSTAQRNFATAIYNLLTNGTWGIGDSANSTSFTNAASDLSTTYFMCDIAFTEQKSFRDHLNELLFPARSRLFRNSSGEWTINVDQAGSSAYDFGDNDGYYNNCEILEYSATPWDEALKAVTVKYHYDETADGEPWYELTDDVHTDFGTDEVYELLAVNEFATAKKVLSYLKNKALYSDSRVKIKVGLEGRNCRRGEIFTLANNSTDYIIQRVSRDYGTNFTIEGREYSASIYGDESPSEPDARDESTDTTYGPGTWINPNDFWEFKNDDFTAVPGLKYNISSASVSGDYLTMTLPSSPSDGDTVQWRDSGSNFATKYLYIARNGETIMGYSEDMVCQNNDENGVLQFREEDDTWVLL